jgi:hypothetical protein
MRSFIAYTLQQILFGGSNQGIGHVACMGEMRNADSTLVGKPEGRDHLENLGVGGKVILERILGK